VEKRYTFKGRRAAAKMLRDYTIAQHGGTEAKAGKWLDDNIDREGAIDPGTGRQIEGVPSVEWFVQWIERHGVNSLLEAGKIKPGQGDTKGVRH
jgi:hypothetical protein